MKILGLDSSGLVASIAVVEDGVLQAEYSTNYKKTHSQTLLPMLEEVRNMIELDMNTIDAIAISAGPGSFTGLRIGAATAKGLGFALEKPLVEIPTLEGLAYNFWGVSDFVCPIMDARRNQVYTGIYAFDNATGKMETLLSQCAIDIEELLKTIGEMGHSVIFLGDGVPVHKQLIAEKCEVEFRFAPAHQNNQRAGSIAALGEVYYREGKVVKAEDHQPEYLRKSQAEREREEKQ